MLVLIDAVCWLVPVTDTVLICDTDDEVETVLIYELVPILDSELLILGDNETSGVDEIDTLLLMIPDLLLQIV